MKTYLGLTILFLLILGCKSPEARTPKSHRSGSFIKESAERNRKLNQEERDLISSLIEKDSLNEYIASENGFYYYYNVKVDNDTTMVEFGDILNFDYNVKDLDGNVIYTKDEIKTQNYAMDQEELFSGLREGLKLMNVGETVTFLFPSQKAFGYYGDSKRIGTNIPIKTEVTLNSIKKYESD